MVLQGPGLSIAIRDLLRCIAHCIWPFKLDYHRGIINDASADAVALFPFEILTILAVVDKLTSAEYQGGIRTQTTTTLTWVWCISGSGECVKRLRGR